MVDKNGIIKHKANIAGQDYRVIQTKIGARGIWNAIDTIKNETNGNVKTLKRKEWYNIFKKYD